MAHNNNLKNRLFNLTNEMKLQQSYIVKLKKKNLYILLSMRPCKINCTYFLSALIKLFYTHHQHNAMTQVTTKRNRSKIITWSSKKILGITCISYGDNLSNI